MDNFIIKKGIGGFEKISDDELEQQCHSPV